MKNKKLKILFLILAFIVPITFFILICLFSHIYPFGDKLLNRYDSWYMYPSIIMELINKLKSGESIFYTFHAGLGTNFISLVNLYAGSPLNLLFLFFKTNQIYLFYALLIYLKLGLSSLSLYIYLKNKNTQKYFTNLLFSWIYSLASFMIAYSYHIMWSDAFYLAPLILLGIDKLIDENKKGLYIIFLCTSIIINYYTGYMICIFALLYFVYRILNTSKPKKEIIKTFAISSLFCGLCCSFILIPNAIALLNGRSVNVKDFFSFNLFNLKSLFYNLLPGSFIEIDNYNDGSCVIGSSIFTLVLVILYFFNSKIPKKEKMTTLFIILFLILSLVFSPLDYFWNMFAKPIWWNSRYSFLIILFLIIIAYKSFINVDFVKIKPKFKSLILIIATILFITSFSLKLLGTKPTKIQLYVFLISLLFFIIYFYLLSFKNKKAIYIVILIMLLIEVGYNCYYVLNINGNASYKKTINTLNLRNNNLNKIHSADASFYRIYDFNDQHESGGMLLSYNSPNLFSSVYNKRTNSFYSKKLNLNSDDYASINHTRITFPNIETLSLLSVKYILADKNTFSDCQEFCTNQYSLPIGFSIDNKSNISLKNNDNHKNIEKIFNYIANLDIKLYEEPNLKVSYDNIKTKKGEIYLKKGKKGKVILEFIASMDGIISPNNTCYYFLDNYAVYLNDTKINKNLFTEIQKGDKVKIIYTHYKDENPVRIKDLYFQILNKSNFQKIINKVTNNSLKIKKDKNYLLRGHITGEEGQKLFLSIPYDEGLIIKNNNKRVKINKEFATFISIDLKKGENDITIEYFPKGLKLGLLLSLMSLVSFGVFSLKFKN